MAMCVHKLTSICKPSGPYMGVYTNEQCLLNTAHAPNTGFFLKVACVPAESRCHCAGKAAAGEWGVELLFF